MFSVVSEGADSDQAAAVTLIDEYQRQLSSKTMNRQGLCLCLSFFVQSLCTVGVFVVSVVLQ